MQIHWKKSKKEKKQEVDMRINKKMILFSALILAAVVIIILIVLITSKQQVVYRETTVEKGNLTVGITETGNISVEESEQTFDADISEYSSDSSDYSWNTGGGDGGMNPFQSMQQILGESSSDSTSSRQLEVEEIFVSVGQTIKAGDPICSLSEETVTSIRSALSQDEAEALTTLEEKQTDAKVNTLSATQEYETNAMYGDYAKASYDITISNLQDAVTEAEEKLEEANETLADNQELLKVATETLPTSKKVLENAEYAKAGTDKETSLYYWLQAENSREEAQTTVDELEDEIETLTDTIKDNEDDVATCTYELEKAEKELESGKIEAQADYDIQIYKYNNAQTIYDTAINSSTLEEEMAEDDYTDAKEKLDAFDASIVDNNLIAKSDGVISTISIVAGDAIYSDSPIITFNSYEDVSVTITIDEDEKQKIEKGTLANITLSAFEDEIFSGEVTEISDATYDSDTGTNNYDITVSVTGDMEKIFDGMSAEVTLITREMKEAVYVSNRAVIRDGTKSYVKVKRNGNIKKIEVKTGFSDGINVEITQGLSENDVVLVESKVSQ